VAGSGRTNRANDKPDQRDREDDGDREGEVELGHDAMVRDADWRSQEQAEWLAGAASVSAASSQVLYELPGPD
jgi:hypothetical protein